MNQVKVYRPDIDGLRAVSILSVLLFHVGFTTFSGGFVGVDVFFVISGYLITKIIKEEIEETNSFSYKNFFHRRIKRLFPALFFTILITFVFCYLLFTDALLKKFVFSVIFALFGSANILFMYEGGYFDIGPMLKPLLHTWSLGVEEQFYLAWPIYLLLIYKIFNKKYIFSVFLISLLVCLLFAIYFNGQRSFFFTPFRAYELLIGSLLVLIEHKKIKNQIINNIMYLIGLVLIAFSVLTYHEGMKFPSYNALVPCVGAFLVIYANCTNGIGKILNNRLFVNIGLISYSLYLVHWPLIVLFTYYKFESLSFYDKITALVVCFVLSGFMYAFIEKPFRKSSFIHSQANRHIFIKLCLLSVFALSIVALYIWNKEPDVRQEVLNSYYDIKKYNTEHSLHHELNSARKDVRMYVHGDIDNQNNMLIIGDSYAGQYAGLSDYLYEKFNITTTILSHNACPAIFGTQMIANVPYGIDNPSPRQQSCNQMIKDWEAYVRENGYKYKYIMLASRWDRLVEDGKYYRDYDQRNDLLIDPANPVYTRENSRKVFVEKLKLTIDEIKKLGTHVILVGHSIHHGKSLEGCDNMPKFLISEEGLKERCKIIPKENALKRVEWINQTVKKISKEMGVSYLTPADYICDNEGPYCRTHSYGRKLSIDGSHLSRYGAIYTAKRWEKSSHFPFTKKGSGLVRQDN